MKIGPQIRKGCLRPYFLDGLLLVCGAAKADITIAALLSLLNQAILMGRNRDIRKCNPTKCNLKRQDKNINKW